MIIIGTITREDIESGKHRSYTNCPLARSLKRRGYKRVSVESYYVELSNPRVSKTMLTGFLSK